MPVTSYRAALRTDEDSGGDHIVVPRVWPHLPNITLTALRIVTGLMFMQHGVQKHFGLLLAPGQPAFGDLAAFSPLWIAGVLEIGGGLLLVLGLFTRPVAFVVAGMMAVAYFTVHVKQGLFPIVNGGELAVLYCFVFLTFSAIGGGRYSLDHAIGSRHKPKPSQVRMEKTTLTPISTKTREGSAR